MTLASFSFAPASETSIPLHIATPDNVDAVLSDLPPEQVAWAKSQKFDGSLGQTVLLPDQSGGLAGALVGVGDDPARARTRFALAKGIPALPEGDYKIETWPDGLDRTESALGWLLEAYRFGRYAKAKPLKARLIAPDKVDAFRIETIAAGETLTRDLINTPAADLGPGELEAEAQTLAETHGAALTVIRGSDLLTRDFPLIHTVGRAASRPPRLIDLSWGTKGPSLTLVGKGVCFDTGGLNLKPGSSMGLMKKDMGGAATVLGLASMIMTLKLPLQLRVLIPAVENSVAGNAFRPQDILTSRKGLSVEINNTDAEGRLVLADALAYACEAAPTAVISMATLTGAARVAVGPDLAPFYSTDENWAEAIAAGAATVADPVWRLPFHEPYEPMIEPGIADLDNAPKGGFAGSITAALFLRRFTTGVPYVHFDMYGWQPSAAPGRPKGGVGQGARAVLEALPKALGL